MYLYNCIWVVLLVTRLTLAFLSSKLSHGIDIVLVCLCPLNSITLQILLGKSYYNWHSYACRLFCLNSITLSKMVDQNISYFTIFVSYFRTKYIDNLKWLTKITNDWYFIQPFFIWWSSICGGPVEMQSLLFCCCMWPMHLFGFQCHPYRRLNKVSLFLFCWSISL
jgi:hypothetical protein